MKTLASEIMVGPLKISKIPALVTLCRNIPNLASWATGLKSFFGKTELQENETLEVGWFDLFVVLLHVNDISVMYATRRRKLT